MNLSRLYYMWIGNVKRNENSIEYRVSSEEDKMWAISAGWRIGIADSYRCECKLNTK